jgi:hypothetical protein
MTLADIKRALLRLDEVTLMEILEITSEDLINRFEDFIEAKADLLEADLEDDDLFYSGEESGEEDS